MLWQGDVVMWTDRSALLLLSFVQTANSKQRHDGTVTNYRNYNRNYKDTLAPGHVPSLLNVFVVAKDAEILRQKGRIDAEYKGGEGIALFCVCVCVCVCMRACHCPDHPAEL